MSWFSRTDDYSIEDSGFYADPEITYGTSEEGTSGSTPSASGGWDDYQREYVSCWDQHTR